MRNCRSARCRLPILDALDHRDAPATVGVGASLLHFLDALPAQVLVDALSGRSVAQVRKAVVTTSSPADTIQATRRMERRSRRRNHQRSKPDRRDLRGLSNLRVQEALRDRQAWRSRST